MAWKMLLDDNKAQSLQMLQFLVLVLELGLEKSLLLQLFLLLFSPAGSGVLTSVDAIPLYSIRNHQSKHWATTLRAHFPHRHKCIC